MEGALLGRRRKDSSVSFTQRKTLMVHAVFEDPNHHLEMVGEFSHPELEILSLDSRIIRYPHDACLGALPMMTEMIGRRVEPGIVKRLLKKGASVCCTHLNTLFKDTVEGALLGRGMRIRRILNEMYPDITKSQLYKYVFAFRPELLNSCLAYSDTGSLIEEVAAAEWRGGMLLETIQELEDEYAAFKAEDQTRMPRVGAG